MSKWSDAQKWERSWWANCVNSLNEELKQLIYLEKMGLNLTPSPKTPYEIDMQGKSVLDIGGGPVSLLLKCINVKGKVIDPLQIPKWVYDRYKSAKIKYEAVKAEELSGDEIFDEVWIYNCLQHSERPSLIVDRARKVTKIIRIFEWIDTPSNVGHPNTLTEKKLNLWLQGEGKVGYLDGKNGCKGWAYWGIFKGERYEEI